MSNNEINADTVKKIIEQNNAATKKEAESPSDIIILQNNYKLKIYPTKLKYFKSGDFNLIMLIRQIGAANLISRYTDGYDILGRFLSAVLDKQYNSEQIKNDGSDKFETKYTFDKTIESLIENDLSVVDIETLIEIVLKVNKIDIENFLMPQTKVE